MMAAREAAEKEDSMISAPDVAREIGASRRAEARRSVLSAAVRLANREARIRRRRQRVEERLAGQPFNG
jgi:hypothetical protein